MYRLMLMTKYNIYKDRQVEKIITIQRDSHGRAVFRNNQ